MVLRNFLITCFVVSCLRVSSLQPPDVNEGCGTVFNQSFGALNVSHTEYNELYCNWTIRSNGIHQALALISPQDFYFDSCGDYVKVLAGNGTEIYSKYGCSYPNRLDVLEIHFGSSNLITIEVRLSTPSGHLRAQFAVVEQSLQSAPDVSPPTSWNITSYNTSSSSLMVDWSSLDPGLMSEVAFFVLSLNQTTPIYDERNSGSYLRITNSSHTSLNVTKLPEFSQFAICVYLVDLEGNILKSQQIIVWTDETVPRRAPYFYDRDTNLRERSFTIRWGRISSDQTRGRLLGYVIYYHQFNEPNNSREVVTSVNTTTVTLTNLTVGITYVISIAGFTRKGAGSVRTEYTTLCGGNLTDESGYFASPEIFNDHNNDDKVRCNWQIRPYSSESLFWLTFTNFSLSSNNRGEYCSGGVRVFVPESAKGNDSDEFEACGQRPNFTLLIKGHLLSITARGFGHYIHQYEGITPSFMGHYQGMTGNLTDVTGEVESSLTLTVTDVSSSSFILSWSTPSSSFLGGLSVDKYLVLYPNSTRIYQAVWLEPHETVANVSGLQAWTNYSVNVIAVLSDGNKRGNTGWMLVATEEGVPCRGANFDHYEALNYSTIFITWLRLPSQCARGIVIGYRVHVRADYPYYGNTSTTTVSSNQLELNITGLQPYTSYRIWIKPFTAKGEGGGDNDIYVRTKCGGAVTNSSGVIQSRGYPSQIESSDCNWDMYPPVENGTVVLTFDDFDLPRSYDRECRDVYVSVSDGSGMEPERFCGQISPFTVVRMGHRIDVQYFSNQYAYSWRGFQARYLFLNEPLISALVLPDWYISAESRNSSIINVTWTQLEPTYPDEVYVYVVVCTPTQHNAGQIIGSANQSQTTLEVRRLMPLTEYLCQVIALLKDNSSGVVTMQGSQTITVSTQEGVPSQPPPNVTATAGGENTIIVSWSPIPNGSVHGELEGHNVFYRRAFSGGNYSVVTVGPSVIEATIANVNSGKYEVQVAGCTRVGCGPRSRSVYVRPGCGGDFNQSFGTLNVSHTDYNYLYCNWTIRSAGIHQAFALFLPQDVYFDCSDYVKIFDGNGTEIYSNYGCRYPYGLDILEIQFGSSNVMIVEVRLSSPSSRLRAQFAVVKHSLLSAPDLSPPTSWNITAFNTSSSSLMVDWSSLAQGLMSEVAFFVLSLNQTSFNDDRNSGSHLRITNSSHTSLNVTKLPEFSQFAIRVYLVDREGNILKSQQIIVWTDETVPRRAPYLYDRFTNLHERSFTFRWGRIYPGDARGRLLGYLIDYHPFNEPNNSRNVVTSVNTTTVTLTNLTIGITYVIFIAGFTRKGAGSVRTEYTTLCGGNVTDESGYFYSPIIFNDHNNYDDNVRCTWQIRPYSSESIFWLTFTNFSLGSKDGGEYCSGGVRVFVPESAKGNDSDEFEACGQRPNFTLLIKGHLLSITARGFGHYIHQYKGITPSFIGHYQRMTENLTDVTGELESSLTLNVIDVSSSSFIISWSTPSSSFLGGLSVDKYLVLYTNSTRIYQAVWLEPHQTVANVSGLQAWTNYSVNVIAVLSDGNKRGSTGWRLIVTEEGVPCRSPDFDHYEALSYDTVFIKWRRLPSQCARGILQGYRVHVQADFPFYGNTSTTSSNQLELKITGLQPHTSYRIWIKPFTAKGEGGQYNVIYVRTKCGRAVTNTSGVIQSPRFPYRIEDSDCIWGMFPPVENGTVVLTFDQFDLPSSYDRKCRDVYVSVSDESGMEPERLCGQRGPFTVVRVGHHIHVKYYSNRYTYSSTGFQARYLLLNETLSNASVLPNWNISAESTGFSSIHVTWTQPLPTNPNVVSIVYAVVCTPTQHNGRPTIGSANESQSTLEVRRLQPLTEYRCQVFALLMDNSSGAVTMQGSQAITVSTQEGGCGGVYNQSSGTLNVSHTDYNKLYCNWTIRSAGVHQARVLVSIQYFYFPYCSDYVKIFSGDGTEIYSKHGCSYPNRLDVLEIHFGSFNHITVQVRLSSPSSRLRAQFAIVKDSLQSAHLPPTAWNITGFNTSSSSLMVDWSSLPQGLMSQVALFVLSLNQTTQNFERNSGPQLWILNPQQTSLNVTQLAEFSQFAIRIYLVDDEGNIFKSKEIIVWTDETVPRQAPYLYRWLTDLRERSVTFRLYRIYPGNAGGRLLGYVIEYNPVNEPNNSRKVVIDTNTTTVTLTNLTVGITYAISAAGFTRKGTGRNRTEYIALCGGNLTDESGYFSSPNISRHNNNDNVQCNWHIGPYSSQSIFWLTFNNFSLGYREEGEYCSGGVRVFVPASASAKGNDSEELEICGQRPNFTLLIQGHLLNITARGFGYYIYRYQGVTPSFEGHYRTMTGNLTDVTGEVESTLAVTVTDVSNTSFSLSWSMPSSSFLGGLSVDKFLVLYNTNLTRIYHAVWLEPHETVASVSGLQAWTNYSVNVIAVLSDGNKRGSTGWMLIETEEGVPSRSPDVYWVQALDHSTIVIRWRGFSRQSAGGRLLGYHVRFQSDYPFYGNISTITVSPNQLELNITGLQPNTQYRIYINGFTARGEGGGQNTHYARTKCGRTVSNTSGVIQSPGYPSRIEYSDCSWDMYPPVENGSIILTFNHFVLPLSYECRDFHVSVSDGSGMEPERLCGQRNPFTVVRQGPRIDVQYHSTRYHSNWTGFQASYLFVNESLSSAPLLADWFISAESRNSSSMNVSWTQQVPTHPYEVYVYVVVCTPIQHNAGPTIGSAYQSQTTLEVRRLMSLTVYRVQVIALLVHMSTGAVIIQGSQTVTVSTQEGVPSQPPPNVTATAGSQNTIIVSWSPIQNASVHGELQGYEVYYRVAFYAENASYHVITVGPSVLEVNIGNLNDSVTYEIQVAACTRVGCGTRSRSVYSYRPGCLVILYDKTGVISSPNFPDNYPSDIFCSWVFFPISIFPSYKIFVVFDEFHTENTEADLNCTNVDFVALSKYNPPNVSQLLGPFCGRLDPFAVSVEANPTSQVGLIFRSDRGFVEKGFNASYFVVTETSKINVTVDTTTITNDEVFLSWVPPTDVQEYIVFYKRSDIRKDTWKITRTRQTQISLHGLHASSEYSGEILGTSTNKTYGSTIFNFTTLQDIDEYVGNPCQNAENCTDGIFDYTCTCAPGYTEKNCSTRTVPRMYPFGSAVGDVNISLSVSAPVCSGVDIPDGGMLFSGTRHRILHICPNGAIQFNQETINRYPYRLGSRHWLRDIPMLAPYWCQTDIGSAFTTGISRVFYHAYTNTTTDSQVILMRATADVHRLLPSPLPTNFKASWVLVVTWENLRPAVINGDTQNLFNTFQAVIITDGVYSFVMFNYPLNGIQWSAPTNEANQRYYTESRGLPVIGWYAGEGQNRSFNYPRSGTVLTDRIDNLPGNTNTAGRWFFSLEQSRGEQDGVLKCIRWFKRQRDPREFTDNLEPCPCTLMQAIFDERYQWLLSESSQKLCVYTRFPSIDNRGRQCCYYTTGRGWGALIVGPGGGTIDRYHRLTEGLQEQHNESDVQGFRYCCNMSRLCHRFYERRPSEGCERYSPPVWSWLWGDPHFVTLDNQNYTFNGIGEYIMVDVSDGLFQLQARTQLAKGEGTASVFVAAVAKEQNKSTVEIGLNSEGNLQLLVDGELFVGFGNLTNTSITLNGSVAVSRPKNNSFLASFPSGISVTVTEVKRSLSIIFAAPESFKGSTKGLLGTWNDDPLDDFLRPDGTTLPSNATGREIHFDFGLLWKVTSDSSLFKYKLGENTSTFTNESFVPIFVDEFQFANDSLRQEAEAVCQGDINCLFDAASTQDVSVGASTMQVSIEVKSDSEELQNFPPKIVVGPSEVNLTVNTSASVTVTAEDGNGDAMTFDVTGTLPAGAMVTSNATSVTLTWNVTTDEIDLEFIVTDSKGAASVLRPVINICACHNQGTCVASDSEDSDSSSDIFNILSCVCENGYTGPFCVADLDACEANFQPCYPGVDCVDLPPPANASGFQCGLCPSGFTGDGQSCIDLNECSTSNGGCSQQCINTPGSFVCECDSGYVLNSDETTCDDVNECLPASDCLQQCENTDGGYICKCDEDFKVDPNNTKNCIPENTCQLNQHGCQYVCYSSGGQDRCSCLLGYALNPDGKTCTDNDECALNQHRCNQNCSNEIGGYLCSCEDGFALGADNVTCNDIDECAEGTFTCSDDSLSCQNTDGSYKCVCEEGLFLIDNKCQGLDKGATPPPTTAPTTAPVPRTDPRTPSEDEKLQAVTIGIPGLDISEWNKTMENSFKTAVASGATGYCSQQDGCTSTPSSSRRRRAASNLNFTENHVHILPGYPKQVSQDPLQASLAFYLQFPSGVSSDVINKDVLVSIVKSSLTNIAKSINRNISSVETLVTTETSTATPATSPGPTEKKEDNTKYYVIAGCVAGGIVIIIIVVVIIVWLKKNRRCGNQRVDSEKSVRVNPADEVVEMANVRSFDNETYDYIVEHIQRMPVNHK